FLAAAVILGIIMRFQGIPFNDIMKTATAGMKGVLPAILVLAFAFSLNQLSKDLGTAQYIISVTESWLTPNLLPFLVFLMCAVISFATGT
ncbi:Na+/H+ antiporter NhaC family protein, partial [Pseudomonas sp. SIMBA_044]